MTETPARQDLAKVTFLPAGDLPTVEGEATDVEVLTRTDWEGALQTLEDTIGHEITVSRKPDANRKQVVNAFLDTFSLIGGVPRLALWADKNETEFFRLWAKLAPKQLEQETNHGGDLRIQHVLPRGALDE